MIVLEFLFDMFISIPRAWCVGLWFLLSSPLQFVSFVEEYKKFHAHVEFADQVQESGLGRLPRRSRRPIIREARKKVKR